MTAYIVSNGQTSTGITLSKGDTLLVDPTGSAVDTQVSSGGSATISGSFDSAVVFAGGSVTVANGGVEVSAAISGGVTVSSGGTDNSATIAYLVGSEFVSSGGTASGTIVSGYQAVGRGGVASGASVYAGLQTVSAGGTAFDTNVVSPGEQIVYGVASSSTVSNGGIQWVYSGGEASSSYVGNSGTQFVESSGVATGTYLHGGSEIVASGGTAVGTDVIGVNSFLNEGGSTTHILEPSAEIIDSGGTASNTSVGPYGTLELYGGAILTGATTISSGGTEEIGSGYVVTSYTVSSGVTLEVGFSGTASDTTVLSGGTLELVEGGSAPPYIFASGGTLEIASGFFLSGANLTGATTLAVGTGGTAVISTLFDGNTEFVDSGGIASDTTVSDGAQQVISSGGSAVDTTDLGSRGTTYILAGLQTVSSGGSAVSTTISTYGSQTVFGTAFDITVLSGGSQTVGSGGVTIGTTIDSGGTTILSSGGTASNVTLGGTLEIAGGTVTGLTWAGGIIEVVSGGTAPFASVGSGQSLFAEGGVANGITVANGGVMTVEQALSGIVLDSGGTEVLAGEDFSPTINNGGQEIVERFGLASGAVVASGGSQIVESGGTAAGTIVQAGGHAVVALSGLVSNAVISGGTLTVQVGGTASGTITFAPGAGGTLQIPAPTYVPAAEGANFQPETSLVVSGFQPGDTLDLTSLKFSTGAAAAFNSATDVLQVSQDSADYDLQLGDVPNGVFVLSSDGNGGTLVTEQTPTFHIDVDYDLSVSALQTSNPTLYSEFTTDIDYAAEYLESLFSNPVTLTLDVGYGEYDGQPLGSDDAGENISSFSVTPSYAALRNALIAEDAPGASGLPASSPDPTANLVLDPGEALALGLTPNNGSLDGYLGFSDASSVDYDFGTAVANETYFVGTVEHEITEEMGRFSALAPASNNEYSPMDLYRYSATGARDLSPGTTGSEAFFSLDGGETELGVWNNNPAPAGGDLGDWVPPGPATTGDDAFDYTDSGGVVTTVSQTDDTLMEALGWTPTATSPPFSIDNSPLSLTQGATATIGSALLRFGDATYSAQQETYTIITAPSDGTLLRNGVALAAGSTFTQADINNGLISYQETGFAPTDSFSFEVSDPLDNTASGQQFQIDVTGPYPPFAVVDSALSAPGDSTTAITRSNLVYGDVAPAADETYTIISGPSDGTILKNGVATTTFTQADINNGLVAYEENGFALSDAFSFSVTDPFGDTATGQLQINITAPPGTPAPFAVVDSPLSVTGNSTTPITRSNLIYGDVAPAADETYTITSGPSDGTILKNGVATTTFTQADINNGVVSYQETGYASADTITFSVADPYGDTTSNQHFQINITAPPGTPAPFAVVDSPLSVTGNSTTPITRSNLIYGDVAPAADETYTIISGPSDGTILKNGVAATTFTQADINNGVISYQETGFASSDTITFSVADPYGDTTSNQHFQIEITAPPGTPSPFAVVDSPLTLTAGTAAAITRSNLIYGDVAPAADETYTITSGPSDGAILKNGVATTTFTQADINNGVISYQETGYASADTITFSVADPYGDTTSNQHFQIDITAPPGTPAPFAVVDSPLSVTGNSTTPITRSNLIYGDVAPPALETYTIISGPSDGTILKSGVATTTFTQADINNGVVSYQETGFASSDTITFSVADPYGDTTSNQQLQVNIAAPPGTPAPFTVVDSPLTVTAGDAAAITRANLIYGDVAPPALETYTVTSGPSDGTILKNGVATTTFTQADIDNGLVSYQETGYAPSDTITFSVADPYGDTTSNQQLQVNVTSPYPPFEIVDSPLTLAAGATAALTRSNLVYGDVAPPSLETYTITSGPSGGTILDNGVATTTFTQADINNGLVSYHETAPGASADSFTFSVSDPFGGTLTNQHLQISI